MTETPAFAVTVGLCNEDLPFADDESVIVKIKISSITFSTLIQGDNVMAIDAAVRDNWEKLQQQYNYPVDALGRPIDPKDQETLKVWRDEGVDLFMKK